MNLMKTARKRSRTGSDDMEHYDALYKASVHANLLRDVENHLRVEQKESENRTINAVKAVDKKLDDTASYLGKRIDDVDKKLDDTVDYFEKRFDLVDMRFVDVYKRFDGVDKRLDGIDNRLDRLEGRFDRLEVRFDRLEDTVSRLAGAVFGLKKWNIGIMLGVATLAVGTIATFITVLVAFF